MYSSAILPYDEFVTQELGGCESAFESIQCMVPALVTLMNSDNFPIILYPESSCRTNGSPRFVPFLTVLYVVITKLFILNLFLALYFEEFKKHQSERERKTQKAERKALICLFKLLVRGRPALRTARLSFRQWSYFLGHTARYDVCHVMYDV